MPHYHCCWGECRSDTRRAEDGVIFIPFVKPTKDLERARRWAYLCGRKGFDEKSITRHTYICNKHFPEREVLCKSNPDLEPFNAAWKDSDQGQRRPEQRLEPVKRRVSPPLVMNSDEADGSRRGRTKTYAKKPKTDIVR